MDLEAKTNYLETINESDLDSDSDVTESTESSHSTSISECLGNRDNMCSVLLSPHVKDLSFKRFYLVFL